MSRTNEFTMHQGIDFFICLRKLKLVPKDLLINGKDIHHYMVRILRG